MAPGEIKKQNSWTQFLYYLYSGAKDTFFHIMHTEITALSAPGNDWQHPY